MKRLILAVLAFSTLAAARAAAAGADDPAAPEVEEGEFIAARAADHAHVRTFGVGPCVVLTLFDRDKFTGALAHMDAGTRVEESVERMLAALDAAGARRSALAARLAGGWQDNSGRPGGFPYASARTIREIRDALSRRAIPVASERVLFDPSPDSRGPAAVNNWIFDLHGGTLETFAFAGVLQSPYDHAAQRESYRRTRVLSAHPVSLGAGGRP